MKNDADSLDWVSCHSRRAVQVCLGRKMCARADQMPQTMLAPMVRAAAVIPRLTTKPTENGKGAVRSDESHSHFRHIAPRTIAKQTIAERTRPMM